METNGITNITPVNNCMIDITFRDFAIKHDASLGQDIKQIKHINTDP